jgi:adenosyl cobinamide kinase/adenosyl cobinamide phosphate guanylyltransferase
VSLVVLIGGARAGKSRLAVELARSHGRPVTFVATAEPGDDEMRERIERHRLDRPSSWATIEEPLELRRALTDAAGVAIVDCLTLWVGNLLGRGDSSATIVDEAIGVAALATSRGEPTIVVTNEVGLGIVPSTKIGRDFRDILGSVNDAFVERSSHAAFVVAGRALPLELLALPPLHA